MATSKAKRKKRKHPGVVIILADDVRRIGARIRYRDPDSEKMTKSTIPAQFAATAALREEWAARKSQAIATRRLELLNGAGRVNSQPLAKAMEAYFTVEGENLRPTTTTLYRAASVEFLAWAAANRVKETRQITRGVLSRYRDHLVTRHRTVRKPGGKPKERLVTGEKVSPYTVSWHVRAMRTIANHWRVRDLVPLSGDDLADALKAPKFEEDPPEFLDPPRLRALVEAAIEHDAVEGSKRSPIAPFLIFTLLTGMRSNEARSVAWDWVDTEAKNTRGTRVGHVKLPAAVVKTKRGRTVSFEPSPSVRLLLLALATARDPGDTHVWGGKGPLPRHIIVDAQRRMVAAGCSEFTWKLLRSTCASYGSNAGSIWGDAAAFASADRLGHSVQIAQRRYVGRVSVDLEAKTLEQAMGIDDLVSAYLARITPAAEVA